MLQVKLITNKYKMICITGTFLSVENVKNMEIAI